MWTMMSANTSNETRAAKKRRYLALREQGVGQAEARLLVDVGRTTAYRWDVAADLSSASGPDRTTKAYAQAVMEEPTAEALRDPGDLRGHLERDVASGVLPAGVFDAFDEPEPDPPAQAERDEDPAIVAPVFNRDQQAPSPGGLLIGVGVGPIRGPLGEPIGDGPSPASSGPPGSAVRVRVRVRNPIPYGDERIGSWR